MLVTVAETPAFSTRAKRLLTLEERGEIVDRLAAEPEAGVLIPGTGGLRKMRIGVGARGRRGGGRVIYWFHSRGLPVVLLWVLAKNEAADLTPEQTRRLKALSETLLSDFDAGGRR